jgi:dCTP deaminase
VYRDRINIYKYRKGDHSRMILSGNKIQQEIINRNIIISDYSRSRLNPNSYNLRLHDKLLVYSNNTLDMKADNHTDELYIPDDGLVLQPNKLYLGRTVEYTETNTYVPMLEGRSSVGRLGIFVHVTAGFGDVGFKGYWTLEIHCIHPVSVYKGVEVCQIYYHTIDGDYFPYSGSKYQNNDDVQPSMLYKDFR